MSKNASIKMFPSGKLWGKLILALVLGGLVAVFLRGNHFSWNSTLVLAIFTTTLVLWMTVEIGWPSILALVALTMIPDLGTKVIFPAAFGNPTFLFLLFTFLLTAALSKTGFIRHVAEYFIHSSFARGSGQKLCLSVFVSAGLLGLVLSPTVLFLLYYPLLQELCRQMKLTEKDALANRLMLGTCFTIAISSGMTPIAHVFPTMVMGFLSSISGRSISALEYSIPAILLGLLTFLCMLLLFRIFLPLKSKTMKTAASSEKTALRLEREEKVVLGIYFFVILLWIGPGLLPFLKKVPLLGKLGLAVPPMVGVVILLLLRNTKGKAYLDLRQDMSAVSWPALMMTASTLAFGAAFTHPQVAITKILQEALRPVLSNQSILMFCFIIALWTAVETNLSSNMVTVTVVSAIAFPLCMEFQPGLAPLLAVLIGFLSSCSFATPPAHPNVALAGSSGLSNPIQVLKFGTALVLIAVALSLLIGVPLMEKILFS